MPYIAKNERIPRPADGHTLRGEDADWYWEFKPENAGELNYAITFVVDDYLARKPLSYAAINEVIGALECAKLELYRRIAAPYENKKMDQNGDVYSKENLT